MAVTKGKVEEIESRVEQDKVYLAWKAPNRPYRKEGLQFMTVPLVISGLLTLILVVAMEWMTIVVVAAMAFAYWAWSVVPAEMTEYAISSRGVRVKDRLYEWWEFSRWWMTEKWGHDLLAFEAPGQIAGRLVLPLGEDMKTEKVEDVMEKLLLHETPPDTFMDKMGKWMVEKFPLEKRI